MRGGFRKPDGIFDPNFIKMCVDVYTHNMRRKKKKHRKFSKKGRGTHFWVVKIKMIRA